MDRNAGNGQLGTIRAPSMMVGEYRFSTAFARKKVGWAFRLENLF
jgi:hypothetical protein